jgi:hypothetical protein
MCQISPFTKLIIITFHVRVNYSFHTEVDNKGTFTSL